FSARPRRGSPLYLGRVPLGPRWSCRAAGGRRTLPVTRRCGSAAEDRASLWRDGTTGGWRGPARRAADPSLARREADMAQPAVVTPLEPLYEGWQRGLAIVAHPDVLEFGAAAAIARWTGQGKQIVYCLVTSGEAGIDAMAPAQARQVCEAEQRAAAAVVGVTVVEFL